MARLIGGSARRTRRRWSTSTTRARRSRESDEWQPLFGPFKEVAGWLERAPARPPGRDLQRPHGRVLPERVSDVRTRRRRHVPRRRRGLRREPVPARPGRLEARLAHRALARRRRVRHHDLPGARGRPRRDLAAPDGGLQRGRRSAGRSRSSRSRSTSSCIPCPPRCAAGSSGRRSAGRSCRTRRISGRRVGTGGLSHQLTGPQFGACRAEAWDQRVHAAARRGSRGADALHV